MKLLNGNYSLQKKLLFWWVNCTDRGEYDFFWAEGYHILYSTPEAPIDILNRYFKNKKEKEDENKSLFKGMIIDDTYKPDVINLKI